MILASLLIAAVGAPATAPVDINRAAIKHVVIARRPDERLRFVIIHGNYALASGLSAHVPLHDGLHLTNTGWRIVCTFSPVPTADELETSCKFPDNIATELAANLDAAMAAQGGNFGAATIAQEHAFASARGPDRASERARLQLLHQLTEQMRTGLITREQAIQQWNQFRLSWSLP